jgi:hypothetical protein
VDWSLYGGGGDGAYVACTPAVLLVQKLAASGIAGGECALPTGAYPCLGLFTLEEAYRHWRDLDISTWINGLPMTMASSEAWQARNATPPVATQPISALLERAFGEDITTNLPKKMIEFYTHGGEVTGRLTVRWGPHWWQRIVASAGGLPKPTPPNSQGTEVRVSVSPDGVWKRSFEGHLLSSKWSIKEGGMCFHRDHSVFLNTLLLCVYVHLVAIESFGPFKLAYQFRPLLREGDGAVIGFAHVPVGVWLFGFRLPRLFDLYAEGSSIVVPGTNGGSWLLDVKVTSGTFGRLCTYQGRMDMLDKKNGIII